MADDEIKPDISGMLYRFRLISSQIQLTRKMTAGELIVLELISRYNKNPRHEEQITPAAINHFMQTKMPATSRLVASLEDKGYIRKFPDNADRRTYTIGLTDAGQEVLLEEEKHVERISDRVMARMGKEEMEKLVSGFKCFSTILHEEIINEKNN